MTTTVSFGKRLLSLFLALLTVAAMMCGLATNADAAVSSRTQYFSNSNAYVTVKIDNSLLNKSGRQYATVKLATYNISKTSADVVVTLTDAKGNTIWSGKKTSTCTLKLGDDHSVYRIYVRVYNKPIPSNWFLAGIAEGDNFINEGKCNTWVISTPKNCTIS